MSKIIIRYDDGVDETTAIVHVARVIEEGRVSSLQTRAGEIIEHYCWLTVFKDVEVSVFPKRTSDATDVFQVRRKSCPA